MFAKSRPTILLVEDDDVDAMLIERKIKKCRLEAMFERVDGGLEALQALRGQGRPPIRRPFLILLDLNIPGMSGHEFLYELRSDPDFQDSVVIILTTSRHEADMRRAYDAHAAGYVIKEANNESMDVFFNMLRAYLDVVRFPSD